MLFSKVNLVNSTTCTSIRFFRPENYPLKDDLNVVQINVHVQVKLHWYGTRTSTRTGSTCTSSSTSNQHVDVRFRTIFGRNGTLFSARTCVHVFVNFFYATE